MMRTARCGSASRQIFGRAFTLIEVVIAVLVLAIAVPPTLNLMDSASAGRVDAINTTRATYLSTTVLETVMADMTSQQANLGFGALADSSAYLTTPTTGLYDRIAAFTDIYTRVGLSYTVVIGGLVSSDGTVSANSSENVFRTVTVQVQINSASGNQLMMPVSLMVSEL
jgi:prepilin-type N-terminal cleavage/methylation domain-containing protein